MCVYPEVIISKALQDAGIFLSCLCLCLLLSELLSKEFCTLATECAPELLLPELALLFHV